MIRLARNIEILLLSNECVVVPNLGGFVAHRLSARYDDGEGLFLPPLRMLGFNSHLKLNDSLLAQSYIEAYDMSYPEAMDAIEDDVRELLRIMGNCGSYELNNLGRLYYDKEGRMNFEPCEAGILTPEFYALSSFDMPVSAENNLQADDRKNDADQERSVRPRVIYIGQEDGRKTLNISLKAIRNISVAAVVLATVFFVTYPLANKRTSLNGGNIESGFYEMFFPKSSDNAKTIAPFNATKPEKSKADKAERIAAKPEVKKNASEAQKKNVKEEEKEPATAKPCWSIVVCTHVTKKNADMLAEEMRKKGFDDVYVSTNGHVKVLYGHFATKEEAHGKLNELNGGEYFKDAWLLEVKQ